MTVYTCGVGGERAETVTVLRPSGQRTAIVCPVHGIVAWAGYKPAGGTDGVRLPDAATDPGTLNPGEYVRVGSPTAHWVIRPPRGDQLVVGAPVQVVGGASGTLTINAYIDAADWKGWLEAGVWIEEER